VKVRWTGRAASDLTRLYDFLCPAAPAAAARIVRELAHAPDRLRDYPRLGEKLETYEPREVRRLLVGNYELRYEIVAGDIIVLRVWHCRESRG
jgi:plasmid stabilization system protein ParE